MGTFPAQIPDWATDSTVASGPEATLPTRVYPTSGVRAQGFQADLGFAARTANGMLGTQGDWIKYLREADYCRLTDTPRKFYIPVEGVCEVQHIRAAGAFDVLYPSALSGTLNSPQPVVQQNITACTFMWQISHLLPQNGILTELRVSVMADSGWTVLPTTMPQATLIAVSDAGTVVSFSPTVTDSSASGAAFQARHDIVIPSLNVDLESNLGVQPQYYFVLFGASDASFLPVYFMTPIAKVKSRPWS